MMAKKSWPIIPVTFVVMGAAIGASPIGAVPRMPFAFGEYREIAAIAFIAVGIGLFVLWQRKNDGEP